MAYHLQAWRENKRLLRFRSLNACHKTFLSGSKISDCPGNYLGSKVKCSNSFDTFFHAFGYNTRDFFFKQRKRETAPNHYNVIYFKVFGAVQVILSAFQSLKTALTKHQLLINALKPPDVEDIDISASDKTDYYYKN